MFAAYRDTLLHPVITQITRVAGFEREDDAGAKLAKLEALLPSTVIAG